jgi:hypothetical protein
VSLRRRPLRLFEMTTDWAPFTGTMTTDPLPSLGDIRRWVRQAVPSDLKWPSANFLPMLPDAGTVILVS